MPFAILLLVTALSGSAAAQQSAGCPERQILATVIVHTNADDSEIATATFRADIRRQPLRITSVARNASHRRAVLLLDASGSMREGNKWRAALSIASSLSSHLGGNVSEALLAVSAKVDERIPFTSDPAEITNRLHAYASRKNFPSGKSPILDSVRQALDMLRPVQLGDTIYLITDGNENSSRETFSELRKTLLAAGVRVMPFIVAESSYVASETYYYFTSELSQLADDSGGRAYTLNPREVVTDRGAPIPLHPNVDRAVENTGVRITLELPGWLADPEPWNLHLVNDSGKPIRNVLILYPHILLPCHAAERPGEKK